MKPPSRDKSRGNQKKGRANQDNRQLLPEAFEERKKQALSSILYIRFEDADAQSRLPSGIDASIPYPVQLQAPAVKLDPSSITIESLLAGMLRVLAWDSENENANKYRKYIKMSRPELFEELIVAAAAALVTVSVPGMNVIS